MNLESPGEQFEIINIPIVSNEVELRAISEKDLNFHIMRVYWMVLKDTGKIRGLHAHKSLRQLVVCIEGQITFNLENASFKGVREIRKGEAFFIDPNTWRTFHAKSAPATLLVLCDADFDESDYIRDYNEFRKEIVTL